ncbi:MAG: VWA domain-containing protein [Acidobacteria bacterium]|nr:VWA domain-containing protein [Acidobacteriota bacterium]
MNQRRLYLILAITLILACYLPFSASFESLAQSGVLIPSNSNRPDEKILSLSIMNVDILIDNQHARVKVLQIFDNHQSNILEGKYIFALPTSGTISDFAIWENNTRIPGVIMEKRRAEAVYGSLTNASVDPGLLQQDDERGGSSAFSVKVFPIPAYGSKRLELEYTEILPIEELSSHFSFPLKPEAGYTQQVDQLNIHILVLSNNTISSTKINSKNYKMEILKSTANEFEASYQASNVNLTEDLELIYQLNVPNSQLNSIAYRAPELISAYDLRDPSLAKPNPDGYFQATAVFNEQQSKSSNSNVLLLLDTSLSMYGDKLVKAIEALELFLNSLKPQEKFNLILFNEATSELSTTPLPATKENISKAINFVKESMLYGGTDLEKGLTKALELVNNFPGESKNIIIISDANATIGNIQKSSILDAFNKNNKGEIQARLFALGLGNDAANNLLDQLVKDCNGYSISARETEDINFSVQRIIDKVHKPNINSLSADYDNNFYQVYSINDKNIFDQGSYTFVGRYRKPQLQATLTLEGFFGNRPINLSTDLLLPEFDDLHSHLPRLWARARVDALLREMDIEGEREDYIAEIIRLAQKYKFVTPYTSFIAAPRALLRPRLIQPGDPVIRVKTDESIKQVFVVLPFGETLPLTYLAEEKIWEVRFFAPASLPDGVYKCRLLMTDKQGQGFQEEKSFVIDSNAPKLQVKLASTTLHAGDELNIKASADKDTIRLIAKLYGLSPVNLHWSAKEQTNIGKMLIPNDLPAGNYTLSVIAEDGAYNQSSQEINLTILPKY